MTITTKQRAYLRSLAMTLDPIFQIGKSSLTPEVCTSVSEALAKRELVKISIFTWDCTLRNLLVIEHAVIAHDVY